ncbi:MAG: cellulose synthase subunit BcsC-related outer membrane protein [Verrucomicrobiota bacterium]
MQTNPSDYDLDLQLSDAPSSREVAGIGQAVAENEKFRRSTRMVPAVVVVALVSFFFLQDTHTVPEAQAAPVSPAAPSPEDFEGFDARQVEPPKVARPDSMVQYETPWATYEQESSAPATRYPARSSATLPKSDNGFREWVGADGEVLYARLIDMDHESAVLESPAGYRSRLALSAFSNSDYLRLRKLKNRWPSAPATQPGATARSSRASQAGMAAPGEILASAEPMTPRSNPERYSATPQGTPGLQSVRYPTTKPAGSPYAPTPAPVYVQPNRNPPSNYDPRPRSSNVTFVQYPASSGAPQGWSSNTGTSYSSGQNPSYLLAQNDPMKMGPGDRASVDPGISYPKLDIAPESARETSAAAKEETAGPDLGKLLSEKRYHELAPIIVSGTDATLATAMAWSLYRDGEHLTAAKWFNQAINWGGSPPDAVFGLALSEYKQGNLIQAEALARQHMDSHPQMPDLLGDITTQRAMDAYENKNYTQAIKYLDAVQSTRALTRDENVVLAWSLYSAGNYQAAAARFERIYSETLDAKSAEGLFASYSQMENWEHVRRLSERYNGPLETLYNQHQARVSYGQGRYRMAASLDPENYGSLAAAYEPSVTMGGAYLSQSGNSDLDEFEKNSLPAAEFSFPVSDVSSVTVAVSSNNYKRSGVDTDDLFGSPSLTESRAFSRRPLTSFRGAAANIRYEREGEYAPSVEFGAREAVGDIGAVYTGGVTVSNQRPNGKWEVSAYRENVDESMISAVGQVDPYTGKSWGGVTETGVRGDLMLTLDENLLFQGGLSIGHLNGTNVRGNDHVGLSTSLKKEFQPGGFEYLTIGPTISYDSYSRNLSHFTFGHGGYFSPQSLVQGTLGLDFMSEEGKSFLLAGNLGAGLQWNSQDAAPLFPLGSSENFFDSEEFSTGIFYSNLSGAYQFTNNLNVGFAATYAKSPAFDEYGGLLYMSYKFEPSLGLFSHDLAY